MIGTREGESMSYLSYKREFWRRLRAWWVSYGERHPDDDHHTQWRAAIERCDAQIARWAA